MENENENNKQEVKSIKSSPYDWDNLFNADSMPEMEFNCFI